MLKDGSTYVSHFNFKCREQQFYSSKNVPVLKQERFRDILISCNSSIMFASLFTFYGGFKGYCSDYIPCMFPV